MADQKKNQNKHFVSTLCMDEQDHLQASSLLVDEYSLEVTEGPHKGTKLLLEEEITQIGRDEFLHISLPEDPRVSKLHCEVILEEKGGVRIRDLGSRNGVFLGGHRILDAYLSPLTKLRVGKSTLQLHANQKQTKIEVKYFDESGHLAGKSQKMRVIFSLLSRLGNRILPVLLTGETGTGKTSVARALHEQSTRSSGPFVNVNCASIPSELLESEFFGHESGAFTGAVGRHKGFFEQANKGTLFLDEIGELPLQLQVKLLSAVEDKNIRRLGSEKSIDVDFRLITATHQHLPTAIKEGRFREDLYYRIAVAELEIPPLRKRLEDIPLLVQVMLSKISPSEKLQLTLSAHERLQRHSWPGNIRELRNVMERTIAFLEQPIIDAENVQLTGFTEQEAPSSTLPALEPKSFLGDDGKQRPLKQIIEETERQVLLQALEKTDWNVTKASLLLEVNRSWSYALIKKHGLTSPHKKK